MMKNGLVIVGLILFVSAKSMALDGIHPGKSVRKEIERIFGTEPLVKAIQISGGDVAGISAIKDGDRIYTIHGRGGRSGYLLSTSAKGRYDLFDYSVIYSDTLSVLGVRVTAYRSSHGGAICSKGWLKQFQGYQGEEIELGKDIDSVSGATVSATSLLADMQRCHWLMQTLGKRGFLYSE